MPNDHDDIETETETDAAGETDAAPEGEADDGAAEAALAAPAKKAKRATKGKAASKKAAAAVRECPPDAELIAYSTKATFSVGQWVSHPTFGTGYVVEAGAHVTLEFGAVKKILAHIPAPVVAAPSKQKARLPFGNTVELARAAGIEVKKMPPRFDGEK